MSLLKWIIKYFKRIFVIINFYYLTYGNNKLELYTFICYFQLALSIIYNILLKLYF